LSVVPTALDNGQRSPRKLLRAVVARLLGPREPSGDWSTLPHGSLACRMSNEAERRSSSPSKEYARAWEYIADWLIENDCPVSAEDYAELREMGERIQLVDKPSMRRLNDYLASFRRLVRGPSG
jgi:hypothetical protein